MQPGENEPTRSGPLSGPPAGPPNGPTKPPAGNNPAGPGFGPTQNTAPVTPPPPFPTNLAGFTPISVMVGSGFAAVYRAHDQKMGRDVAVKRLLPVRAADPQWRARFDAEGRIQGDPAMPAGVVHVYQRGDDQYGPYLVMEWVDGGSLEDWHKRFKGRGPWRECVRLCQEIAETMHKVHGLRYLHRDLKPANVLLSNEGRTRVCDFGLARRLGTPAPGDPRTQQFAGMGTFGFAAPEQYLDFKHAGPKADQWSLAAILHLLLTNECPDIGHSTRSVACCESVMRERGIPDHIRKAVCRALAYDPQARFDSMADFCTAIGGSRSSPGKILAVAVTIVALLAIVFALVSSWFEPASKSGVSAKSKAAETVLTVPNTAATVSGSNLSILTERTPAVDSVIPASDLVTVLPGTFVMGQDGANAYSPKHSVEISRTLQVSRFEITQEQWFRVMGTRPWLAAGGRDDSRLPTTGVTWRDAMEFCERLTQLENSGRQYRLPTEAEWEYFSRGGSSSAWSCPEDQLAQHAWCAGSVGSADAPGPRPVGTRQPNPLGLHDVHGNVFEWCLDWFDPDYYLRSPAADPSGPLEPPAPADTETLAERVCRGGSWARNDVTCSSGFRFSASDEDSRSSLEFGFRVVAEDRGAPQAR